jgi:hypothetical protein
MAFGFGKQGDEDAQSFLTTAGITNNLEYWAVVKLTRDLKFNGIWSKMKAIYPFVGGTSTTHKFNLKDPRDLNDAFRLTFSGGWTHSSTGAKPNGTNAYADTYLVPATHLTDASSHLSVYPRDNTRYSANGSSAANDIGAFNTGFNKAFAFCARFVNDTAIADSFDTGTNRITTANSDSRGFFVATRTSLTSHKMFKNGIQLGSTNTNTSTGRSDVTVSTPIAAYWNGSSRGNYSTREYAFISMGDGLTDSEVATYYTIVQTFQTTLGRQV